MKALLALLLVAGLFAGGCWDRREADELAIIDAFGADWVSGQYQATAEVINARAVSTPGQTGSGASGQPETSLLVGRGATPSTAWADLEHVSPRYAFWAPAEVLVIGEGLARHGIRLLLDDLARDPSVRLTPHVFISHGMAAAILATRKTGAEISVARDLRRLADLNRVNQSAGWAPHIYDLLRWDSQEGRAAVVMGVRSVRPPVSEGPAFQLPDSAVLQHDRLVAWIPRPTARMQLWLVGRFVRSTFDFDCPGGSGQASVNVVQAKGKVRPLWDGPRLRSYAVRLSAQGLLVGTSCPGASWEALQQAARARIETEARQAIAWAQGSGYDMFGLGEDAYRGDPHAWLAGGFTAGWGERLAHVPVSLTVALAIRPTQYAQGLKQGA